MAPTLLQKLFSSKRGGGGGSLSSAPREGGGAAELSWSCSASDLKEVRLIVYQDCERRGREVLFDSTAVHKIDGATFQDASEQTLGRYCQASSATQTRSGPLADRSRRLEEALPKYQYTRPASDVSMLGEMMFGSVAMSYKGCTLKIHHIRSPPQLMMTKVFSARVGSLSGNVNSLPGSFDCISQDPSLASWNSNPKGLASCYTGSHLAQSTPVDMPGRGQNEDRDSGITQSASLSSFLRTPWPSLSSSSSSYQRRWRRNQTTSLENGIIPRWSTEETFSLADESYGPNPAMVRRKKIAISVIFSLPEKEEAQREFQDFFFSHFPLFESHVSRLKNAIEMAMIACRKIAETSQRVQVYISRVMDALSEFRIIVCNLYFVPRIAEPVWLTMMSGASEKNQLCQHFLQEFTVLIDQTSKNQFFAALLTAVLTYHLAWVPTVMPADHQLPVKTFSEKRASPSVNMLAKSHPYNPLWAQIGDLYGALGSPVRMARTVIVGKRQDLVQRLLYVLTYFLRCSELQENQLSWSRKVDEGDEKERALLPPALHPKTGCSSPGSHEMCFQPSCLQGRINAEPSLEASVGFTKVGSPKAAVEEGKTGETSDAVMGRQARMSERADIPQNSVAGCPACSLPRAEQKPPPLEKVTFHIGSSTSPESEVETPVKERNKALENLRVRSKSAHSHLTAKAQRERSDCSFQSCARQQAGKMHTSTAPRLSGRPSVPSHCTINIVPLGQVEEAQSACCENLARGSSLATKAQGCGQALAEESCRVAPWVEGASRHPFRVDGSLPRNESSDSALGESDGEGSSVSFAEGQPPGPSPDPHEEVLSEVALALPRCSRTSNPRVRHFGRSLLGGYSASYMPDLVLHGIRSDKQLKQTLPADLNHSVKHPVLDEPIAEAVCIIADTDHWTVQVATSQRKVVDKAKLGKEILVSSQVSSLLQSLTQLYKLNLPADFCLMHLENQLQEMYLKSKMLSKYLRGHTRVHVKDLGVVLGIEASDLPLLAAIASTHSPYVAQILL